MKEAGVTVVKEPYRYRYQCPWCGHEVDERISDSTFGLAKLEDGLAISWCPECKHIFNVYIEDWD